MNESGLTKWKTTKSQYLVNDRWLRLRADTCTAPDGKTIAPWYVLEYPEWINCVAIDRQGYVLLLKHYRHGADEYITEIPAGVVDGTDASPKDAMTRELKEELGYQGGEIHQTGVSYANPSSQNNRVYSFLAIGGDCSADKLNELGADFVVRRLALPQFVKFTTSPTQEQPSQALHLASIFFALNYIWNTPEPTSAILRLREMLSKP